MTGKAVFETRGRVAVVRLTTPRGGVFTSEIRRDLMAAVERLETDEAIGGLLIADTGSGLPSGNDAGGDGPSLSALLCRIEAAPKPVMVAAAGPVLGAGLDLALAAHLRAASESAVFGYPEVQAGMLPEAGGTQRLPRLVGGPMALDMLLGGETVSAKAAQTAGLINVLVAEDTFEFALQYIQRLADSGASPQPTGAKRAKLQDADRYLAAVARHRAAPETAMSRTRRRVLDCVEAALLLPFEAGLALEGSLRAELAGGTEAQALVYMLRAESAAGPPAEIASVRPRRLERIGIVGGGLTGAGLAISCLKAGFDVILSETEEERLEDAVLTVIEHFDADVAAGRMTAEESQGRIERLTGVFGTASMADVDVAVEAVGETAAAKQAALAALDAVLPAGAVLLTTARKEPLNSLAQATSRGVDMLGLDLFTPVAEARAAELRPGDQTGRAALATAFAFVGRLGKFPVLARQGPIGRRLLAAYWGAADYILFAGAEIGEIDAAMRAWGAPHGPFEMRDIGGLQANARAVAGPVLDDTLRGVGKRYYRAAGGPDPEVAEIIAAARAQSGLTPRSFSAAEIRRRCLAALVNEGARLLADGIAPDAMTIDLIAVHGLGLPRGRGGPMKAAELVGLKRIAKDLVAFAGDGPLWKPEPLIAGLAEAGLGFASVSSG